MKTRHGFVSNSSSSSFVVMRELLSDEQLAMLYYICNRPIGQYKDEWNVHVDCANGVVRGYTYMDNGQDADGLEAWLRDNNYPMSSFKWDRN